MSNCATRTMRSHVNETDSDGGYFGGCDFTSYCYFSLAIILFTVGTVVTVFATADEGTATIFSSLGHMWLVGPIFISSGLMVAVKTVLYLRKKNIAMFIVRQRTVLRQDVREGHHSAAVARNASTITLPPSYDSAVCQLMPDSMNGNRDSDYVLRCTRQDSSGEAPPPSYDEAMILVDVQHRERMLSSAIEEFDCARHHLRQQHTKDSAA